MSVNKVILIGYVGKDPRVKHFDSGAAVATFPFATTDRAYTLANGTQVPERTEWHNAVATNRLAEVIEKYVHKGDKLYLECKLRTRSYDDNKGVKHYITEVYVDNMEMLTPKVQQQAVPTPQPIPMQQPQATQRNPQQAQQPVYPQQVQQPVYQQPPFQQAPPLDDLPF